MPFSTHDQIINALTNLNQRFRFDWSKNFNANVTGVAGESYCFARNLGSPAADSIYNTGTNLAFQATSDSTLNAGGIPHGGNVSPMTKHLISASVGSAAATSCPAKFTLVDILGFYRVTSVTTITSQTLNNTVTLPRYTDGVGVQAFAWNTNATALGAATPTLTLNYTNHAGVAGKTTPATLPTCKSAAGNSLIMYSGTGAGKYPDFIPLAQGDLGIRSIQSITLSASYVSGEFSIALCKPIMTIPAVSIGVFTERDYVNQLPSLPQIQDGANLHWIMYAGSATPVNTSFMGHLEFGWN